MCEPAAEAAQPLAAEPAPADAGGEGLGSRRLSATSPSLGSRRLSATSPSPRVSPGSAERRRSRLFVAAGPSWADRHGDRRSGHSSSDWVPRADGRSGYSESGHERRDGDWAGGPERGDEDWAGGAECSDQRWASGRDGDWAGSTAGAGWSRERWGSGHFDSTASGAASEGSQRRRREPRVPATRRRRSARSPDLLDAPAGTLRPVWGWRCDRRWRPFRSADCRAIEKAYGTCCDEDQLRRLYVCDEEECEFDFGRRTFRSLTGESREPRRIRRERQLVVGRGNGLSGSFGLHLCKMLVLDGVEAGTPADRAGLSKYRGLIVSRVDGRRVETEADCQQIAAEQVQAEGRATFAMLWPGACQYQRRVEVTAQASEPLGVVVSSALYLQRVESGSAADRDGCDRVLGEFLRTVNGKSAETVQDVDSLWDSGSCPRHVLLFTCSEHVPAPEETAAPSPAATVTPPAPADLPRVPLSRRGDDVEVVLERPPDGGRLQLPQLYATLLVVRVTDSAAAKADRYVGWLLAKLGDEYLLDAAQFDMVRDAFAEKGMVRVTFQRVGPHCEEAEVVIENTEGRPLGIHIEPAVWCEPGDGAAAAGGGLLLVGANEQPVVTMEDVHRLAGRSRVELHFATAPPGPPPPEVDGAALSGEWVTIGAGNFGKVMQVNSTEHLCPVAVKELRHRPGTSPADMVRRRCDFVREMRRLAAFRFNNILNFYGWCERDGGLCMVTELCEGNYREILARKREPLPLNEMLLVAQNVARAVHFLHQKRFAHLDIAARNVFRPADSQPGSAKLGDFGMCTKLGGSHPNIAVPWAPPEALADDHESRVATVHFDCWSYGVLCWELLNTGQDPYSDVLKPVDFREAVQQHVVGGGRLQRPAHCSAAVWIALVAPCQRTDPSQRPAFDALVQTITELRGADARTAADAAQEMGHAVYVGYT
eukprot:TRINITY_DN3542_c0_g1_i1.p1 TRINITY_DN3542_c0_g1~~TRINITY_DN3542_c0_g1_i1.p1  ORF type:complete len:936 (+),score=246.37 TRINITY_DN3542_c0_g1_i1:69-2876(+)